MCRELLVDPISAVYYCEKEVGSNLIYGTIIFCDGKHKSQISVAVTLRSFLDKV